MSGRKLVLGSRGSALALAQSGLVAQALKQAHAGLEVEIRVIRTQGDKLQEASLVKAGGKGLFTKEIEDELLAGRVDLAVHSLKDLPTRLAPGLALAAVSARADARDAWVSSHASLAAAPAGERVGTSSPRRKVQLMSLRPDLEIVDFRGNVDTRVAKVRRGEVAGAVMAAAGLSRLGRAGEAAAYFSLEEILPAPGQGFLGIESRENDPRTLELLAVLDDSVGRAESAAERGFLDGLGGGCQLPVAAYAKAEGKRLRLRALVANLEATKFLKDAIEGGTDQAEALGRQLAQKLTGQGAMQLLGPHGDSAGSRES